VFALGEPREREAAAVVLLKFAQRRPDELPSLAQEQKQQQSKEIFKIYRIAAAAPIPLDRPERSRGEPERTILPHMQI